MNERIGAACGAIVPLLAANFLLRSTGAAMGVVTLYLTRINARVRPVTALEVSLIVVVSYSVVELTLSPFAGALSDRYGSHSPLLLGVMLAAAGVQLTAFTTATVVLLITRLLVGLGDALTTPLLLKQLTALSAGRYERRARVMTLNECLQRIGVALFASVASALVTTTVPARKADNRGGSHSLVTLSTMAAAAAPVALCTGLAGTKHCSRALAEPERLSSGGAGGVGSGSGGSSMNARSASSSLAMAS